MIDTAALLQGIDLPSLIARDTDGPAKSRMYCPRCQVGGSSCNNSPALSVRDGYYHCFGCGEEGDAISYIMARDKVDFQESCKRLGWDGYEPDKAELARRNIERQAERDRQQVQRAVTLDAMLADYSAEEIWHAYNRRMTTDQRAWWIKRGIEPDWQDYLQLGFVPNKTYRGKDNILYHSPAYTIPYFHTGHKFQTMQYRLENPDNPKDRYRFEHGLKAAYYQVIDSEPIQECAIICEGAIKAMVTHIYGDTGERTSVLAVPAKETYAGVVEAVKHCHHVWIILDPDCWDQPKNAPTGWEPSPLKLAKQIGKASRIVRLAYKVDDLFIAGLMPSERWKNILRDAQAMTGFTMLPDEIMERYGLITAAVYGVVMRYCQMDSGTCTASQRTIANRAGVSHRSAINSLNQLVTDKHLNRKTIQGIGTTYARPAQEVCSPCIPTYAPGAYKDSSLRDSLREEWEIQVTAETAIGLKSSQADIQTLQEWEKLGVIEADIIAALKWRTDNEMEPVKTISQLNGGVKTSRNKRIQTKKKHRNDPIGL